ncbi:MAG: S-layer homology domain-containing protein [Thermosynechococcaceae cyanobacterium]
MLAVESLQLFLASSAHPRMLLIGVGLLGAGLLACDRSTLQNAVSADPKTGQWTDSSPKPMQTTTTPSPAVQAHSGATTPSPSTLVLPVSPALQVYVSDVIQLNPLTVDDKNRLSAFNPNQPILRSTFARWLVETNNRIYRDRPSRQIRTAVAATPAFQDVPSTHPDFADVQGLAESGYLPSILSGDKTQALFRPQDPLTRETLLLWKVPIDRQQIPPTVSTERVKQLWGFKDANRITPLMLSAVAADHLNGDLANIRRMFGATILFQPQKPVTQAEAAASLWFIGIEGENLSVQDLLRAEQRSKTQPTAEATVSTPVPQSSMPPSPAAEASP